MSELKTPEEFSNYYYQKLKNELNVSNINLNRLGFVGFFIELLGNTQFDIKSYYDHLFNESFPITSRENQNLLYHSDVFGYTPQLATPSQLQGQFEFNIQKMAENNSNVKTRIYELQDISLSFSEIEFRSESKYKLIFNYTAPSTYSITGQIYDNDKYDTHPLKYSYAKIPIIGFKQYNSTEITRHIPKYPYGSFNILDIPLNDYLYNLTIFVREKNHTDFEKYDTSISKFEKIGNDKTVFYKILPNNILRIELGSGIRGNYIPEAEVKITINTTKGEEGNIGTLINNYTSNKFNIFKFDYDFNDNLIDSKKINNIKSVIKNVTVSSSIDGKNSETEDILKSKLIKYIQSRKNLVSQVDYNNILQEYFPHSDVLFKKSGISENIIYVYNYFLNNYSQPFRTITKTLLISVFDNKIAYPKIIINGETFVSPFYYEYNELLNTYDGFLFDDNVNFYPTSSPILSPDNDEKAYVRFLFDQHYTFLNLVYDFQLNKTTIYVKNKYFKTTNNLTLQCKTLNINSVLTNKYNDMYYYVYDGVIKNFNTFILTFEHSGIKHNYYFNGVTNAQSTETFLRLKKYIKDSTQYVINVPLIHEDNFNNKTDKDMIDKLIKTNFINVNISDNRMISDDVQVRFCNTINIPANIVKKITKQKIDNDIKLPFLLKINLTLDRNDVMVNSISITELEEDIREAVSKFILDTANGIYIKYYNTQIIDICHNFDLVKSCKVQTFDSDDFEITPGIELLNKLEFVKLLTKDEFLDYSSIYWWFDINNIQINTTLI